jgi:FixJ family two-component response regulator
MNPAVKVFVVDDEHGVRKGLERLFRAAGFEVETSASAEDFLTRSEAQEAGCLVLDYRLPGLDGLELQEVLAARESNWQVIFLTGRGDIPATVQAMQAGAVDFLEKPADESLLLSAVRRALHRATEAGAQKAALDAIRARVATLSARERQVMEHVIKGRLNKQIAYSLGTAERTVKVQRAAVMQKMGAKSVAELVRMAARIGIEPTST